MSTQVLTLDVKTAKTVTETIIGDLRSLFLNLTSKECGRNHVPGSGSAVKRRKIRIVSTAS